MVVVVMMVGVVVVGELRMSEGRIKKKKKKGLIHAIPERD